MKKLIVNFISVKNIWIVWGTALLLTMSPIFQGLFGPFLYFDQYQMSSFPFIIGRYCFFFLSFCGFIVAYHQKGKNLFLAIFFSLVLLVIEFILVPRNTIFMSIILLTSFLASFLPLAFFIYASIKIHKQYFFSLFVGLVAFFMGVEICYFIRSWDYGLRYQGLEFLHHSIVKSVICFSLIYILTGFYYKVRNIAFLHAAILLFCITISIVAFPWLGELI